MTEFVAGQRVRVAVPVPPQGGPSLPEGATGVITHGNYGVDRFPHVPFVSIRFDAPHEDIPGSAWLASRFEAIEPEGTLPGGTLALVDANTKRLIAGMGVPAAQFAAVVAPKAVSEALSEPEDAFPVDARVHVGTLGLLARVTDYLPPSAETVYVALDGSTDPTLVQRESLTHARVYVSGPMTGYDGYNFPAFNAEADRLRAEGWQVENPADKGIVDGWTWEDYLRYDLRVMADCHAILTLPNWNESPGANLEMIVAQALGIEWVNPDGRLPDITLLFDRGVNLSDVWEWVTLPESASPDATIGNTGEVRTVSSTGGEKGVKPARFDLIPAGPLWSVAEHYGKGAEKYEDRNWERGYEWSKSFQAMQRHAWAFWSGEDIDPETNSPHMAAVVFHAFALLEFMSTHPEFDNRSANRIGNIQEALV